MKWSYLICLFRVVWFRLCRVSGMQGGVIIFVCIMMPGSKGMFRHQFVG